MTISFSEGGLYSAQKGLLITEQYALL